MSASIPIYVTRKTADGVIASYSISLWMTLLLMFVIYLNVIGWGLYGLYLLGRAVFG